MDIIYYNCLKLSTKIKILYTKLKKKIINTDEVLIIDDVSNEPKNITCNYYAVRTLNYFILSLKKIRNYFDVSTDKIHIVKNYGNGKRMIIIDSNINEHGEYITMKDTINHLEENKQDDIILNSKYIFINFEIESENGQKICIKKYLLSYNDNRSIYSNTLDNIMNFNNINIDKQTAKINIKIFIDGKFKKYNFIYKNVCYKHINYFYDLK